MSDLELEVKSLKEKIIELELIIKNHNEKYDSYVEEQTKSRKKYVQRCKTALLIFLFIDVIFIIKLNYNILHSLYFGYFLCPSHNNNQNLLLYRY